jgi:transcriptional regulator with XRE-family HTH domain
MKKYHSIGELLLDYRTFNSISQAEMALLLNVDARSISRWENAEALVRTDKEEALVKKLNIPHQVVHNLNSEHPIPIFYDLKTRTYSLTKVMTRRPNTSWYKADLPVENERLHPISNDSDIEFVNTIQLLSKNDKLIRPEVIKTAAVLLPELNLVLYDHSGFYAGHISVLPLKTGIYQQIRNREITEDKLKPGHLAKRISGTRIFYFYSMYADNLDHSYYLINTLLGYFKKEKFTDYRFAGITFKQNKVELLQEMGLQIIWTDEHYAGGEAKATLLEGNFDMFLFGKMQG